MRDEYKTRIQPTDVVGQKNPTHKNAAKIFLHPTPFDQAGFANGGICLVEVNGVQREAVTWRGDTKVANNIASISRVFQDVANIELGQIIRIVPGGAVASAQIVVIRETTSGPFLPDSGAEHDRWVHHLEYKLELAEYILPGTPFEDVSLRGFQRSFIVESVNGSAKGVVKYDPATTVVEISNDEAVGDVGKLSLQPLPNMGRQIEQLNDFFDEYDIELANNAIPPFTCGIVIDGTHGTGKTMLLDHLAATRWGRVVRITEDDKPSAIQTSFETAIEQRGAIMILIDDILTLIGKNNANRPGYMKAIKTGLDELAKKAQADNRRPNVLVVATCLDYLEDIPYDLQRPGRFWQHISLPTPDAPGRAEILRSMKPPFPSGRFEKYISDLVDRTHAYTGGDLRNLLAKAMQARRKRVTPQLDSPLEWEDVAKIFSEVRPSAMRDINLKPPTIHWSDIGGYEGVKLALQDVLRTPDGLQENLWVPTKGVLLYGPPGCSKTMTAQAMATETGFNFFAVKGGELLNMYVGETERSIRNIFKRAAEASPSIIFFDEIDSLAGTRSSGSGGGGVQAVTTLLTEMAGFEERGNIFVLAATNRPDSLDPALLRPGRFDELIYVPLPDVKAREAIIARMSKKLLFQDIDVAELARMTEGYSGAEVANICGSAFSRSREAGDSSTAMEVLRAKIRSTPRGVTQEHLGYFNEWHNQRKGIF
ncbi:P-loop containing nucleoside triphosphate hydrolase protein [Xylaria bambusicola]|uniref:P-loop containing nucleoside triphosphate hydrolase protein n=1 Tax=Xylaria bambusicola TaxID=326684 RepID=UPI0020086752|nr:P-loop containing nucleoside triphosphate hydrolase protein [Xylaria bambusicola]KAI0516832.1 P-loop containing nucleoside triphosphate hydrolase protein [Xylaria bambusicola]